MKKINNASTIADSNNREPIIAFNNREPIIAFNNNAAISVEINEVATKVISIDAATKSLAVACLNLHNVEQQNLRFLELIKYVNINPKLLSHVVNELNEVLTPITIKSLEVIDLIPNKQVAQCGLIERSAALMTFLHRLTQRLIADNWLCTSTHLIIEYQMGQNRKSGDIQTQIIYHFLQYLPQENIHIIGPSLKNKLSYVGDLESKHSYHIAKYNTLYTANKSHTKYLFIKWLTAHKQMHQLQQIKKKNYADIADAFCQAAAWHNIYA